MNVFTVLPNYYYNQMITPQLTYTQPTPTVSPFLNSKLSLILVLSQALKASIISYENSLFSQNQIQNIPKNNK